MNIFAPRTLAAIAAVAALAVPQLAVAQATGLLSMSSYVFPSALSFSVTGRGTVGAGGFNASFDANGAAPPAPTSFVAFCVDLAQSFSFGNAFSVTATSAATIFGSRASTLDRLYTQRFGSISNRVESAAFQLAIWEILQDAPTATFGTNALSSGSFMATAATSNTLDDSSAITLANSWLNSLTGVSGGYALTVLASATHQDQLMATPVPEPETYMMLLAGLGLMGYVARRRRQGAAV